MIKSILNTDADRRRTVLGFPVGAVVMWGSDSPPSGWELCDGREIPIDTYQSLYNLITANDSRVNPYGSNTNGSGNPGSSHFRLPNMQDRFLMSPTWTANNPGSGYAATTGGTTSHSHAATPLVSATVLNQNHSHGYTKGNTNNDGAHEHTANSGSNTSSPLPNQRRTQTGSTKIAVQSHSHNVASTGSSGGGHSHNTNGPDNTNSDAHTHPVNTVANSVTTSNAGHLPLTMRANYIVYTGIA
jgi:microcystin-dependent protein